ncbi:MAG: HD domain-containing protein [Proteobacteria bacterium]|nr:HD domain-containing protein [Pseudomonadota bacterium]
MTLSNDDMPDCIGALAEAGGDLYEVGGPVRDRLMGRPVKDRDILCRGLPMKRICAVLRPLGTVAGVGKSFGVIKFSPRGRPGVTVDIALPRRERSTGVGHRDFDVDYDPAMPVEEDLGRRDFTVNAMALSLADSRLIDPFGGRADIERRVLRMVFPRAFEEDPLRLMRAIQFAARLGFTIEPATLKSMKEHAPLIATVSGERIGMELAKLMSAGRPSVGFDLMLECGLMEHVLPEMAAIRGIEQDKQPGDDVYSHTMRALDAARADPAVEHRGDIDLMFACLMHDVGKAKTARFHAPAGRTVFFGHQLVSKRLAMRAMERLRLAAAGVDTRRVSALIEHHMFETKASYTDRAIRRFVSKVGQDLIFMLVDLRIADNRGGKHPAGIKGVQRLRKRIAEELAKKPPFGPKDLAVDGHDLMAAGVPRGPTLGAILAALVDKVLDEPALNTRDELLALAREMMENPVVTEAAAARSQRRIGREKGTGAQDHVKEAKP